MTMCISAKQHAGPQHSELEISEFGTLGRGASGVLELRVRDLLLLNAIMHASMSGPLGLNF